MKVFQSALDLGEKSLVPSGQLLLSFDRRTSKQLLHFTMGPGEYGPLRVTRSHLQDFGLPLLGFVGISVIPTQSFASIRPFAIAGSELNSAFLYAGLEGKRSGRLQVIKAGALGYFMIKWLVLHALALHELTS